MGDYLVSIKVSYIAAHHLSQLYKHICQIKNRFSHNSINLKMKKTDNVHEVSESTFMFSSSKKAKTLVKITNEFI